MVDMFGIVFKSFLAKDGHYKNESKMVHIGPRFENRKGTRHPPTQWAFLAGGRKHHVQFRLDFVTGLNTFKTRLVSVSTRKMIILWMYAIIFDSSAVIYLHA